MARSRHLRSQNLELRMWSFILDFSHYTMHQPAKEGTHAWALIFVLPTQSLFLFSALLIRFWTFRTLTRSVWSDVIVPSGPFDLEYISQTYISSAWRVSTWVLELLLHTCDKRYSRSLTSTQEKCWDEGRKYYFHDCARLACHMARLARRLINCLPTMH